MADSARYVFQASRDAHTQITRMFDFVEPTAIAMWNLRWQVKGFLEVVPSATSTEVSNRFSLGSGFRGGSIKRAVAEITWDQQQEQFATIVLVNAIVAFEDFTASIERISKKSGLSKKLQFPSSANGTSGRGKAYFDLGSDVPHLAGIFSYDPAVARRYSNNLDELLICYRFFKELRNCIAHNGGKANQAAVDAYVAFAPVASVSILGVEEVPAHKPISAAGDAIILSLRGVIGFSGIILRLLTTYDVDFSKKKICIEEFRSRFAEKSKKWSLPKEASKKLKRLSRELWDVDMPRVTCTSNLLTMLKGEGVLPRHL